MEFPDDTAFDCFKLNNVSSGKVLKFDKFNFIGYADFNKKRIYRKVSLSDGVISIPVSYTHLTLPTTVRV